MPRQPLRSGTLPVEPITIEVDIEAGDWPPESKLTAISRRAVDAVQAVLGLRPTQEGSELSVLFSDDAHIRLLNAQWRAKDKPTSVLSFPAFAPAKNGPMPPLLGDIVLAFETVKVESISENKPFEDHVTHLIVHGLLHLLGYDHETESEAIEMEELEVRVLATLAIADPYA